MVFKKGRLTCLDTLFAKKGEEKVNHVTPYMQIQMRGTVQMAAYGSRWPERLGKHCIGWLNNTRTTAVTTGNYIAAF